MTTYLQDTWPTFEMVEFVGEVNELGHRVNDGGSMSSIVTVKLQSAVFLSISVADKYTSVTPAGKTVDVVRVVKPSKGGEK